MSLKLFLISCWPLLASAQLQLMSDTVPQAVFGAGERTVNFVWHNSGAGMVSVPVRMQVYQASSTIAAVWNQAQDWKRIEILPHQTILENAPLKVPPVNSETRFVVQWLDETNKIIGHMDVMVYPTNLLNELRPLAGDQALGIFDPENQLKPLLKMASLDFEDLESEGVNRFSGKLAIIGPLLNSKAGPSASKIAVLASKGAAVVWIRAAEDDCSQLQPSFYFVPKGKGEVVVADAALVANLSDNPRSQLNLVNLSRLAVRREIFELPGINDNSQP